MRLKMIDRSRLRWPMAALLVGLLATFLLGVNGSAYLSLPGLVPASGCPTGAVLATDQFTTTGIPSSLTVSPNSTAVAGAWVLANDYVAHTGVVASGNCTPGSMWPLNVMGALITTTITNARDADIQEMTIYQDSNFNGRFDPGIDLPVGRTYTGADLDAGKALFSNGGASPVFTLTSVGGGTLCRTVGVAGANFCAVSLLAVVKIGPNPVSGSDFALQLEAVAGDIPGALAGGGPVGGARVSDSFGASANPQGSNITLHIIGGTAPGGGSGGGAPPPPPGAGGLSLSLHAGWNMISTPVSSSPISSLQGNCSFSGGPWEWNGTAYQLASVLEPAKGYWVKVGSPCTMQAGGSSSPQSLSLVSGWNLISSSGSWNQMNTGGCTLLSGPWWYDGTRYQQVPPATPMEGFKGYWAKVGGGCTVSSQSAVVQERSNGMPPAFGGFPRPPSAGAAPLQLQSVRLSAQGSSIRLQVAGSAIESTELRLYTLAGRLIVQAQGTGNRLRLMALSREGRPLANGVYLYIVTVKSADGQMITSEVKKLVVLR